MMYLPGMLPSTCILPSQSARIEGKRREKQRLAHVFAREAELFKDVDASSVSLSKGSLQNLDVLCRRVASLLTSPSRS